MTCGPLPPGCPSTGSFTPIADTTLAAGIVSASVSFAATGANVGCLIYNAGPDTAYIAAGNTTIIATLTSPPVLAGQYVFIEQGFATNLAAITASGTAALTLQSGTGNAWIVYGQVNVAAPLPSPYVGPDNDAVVTPGTAVVAFAAGEIVNGAVIINPPFPNLTTIFVDPVNVAGTLAAGTTVALPPGASAAFQPPPTGAITVNSTAAATFNGWRF